MKVKILLSILMVLTMLFSGVFSVSAAADDGISYKISYSSKYTYLELEPSESDHTLRYTTDGSVPDENSTLYRRRLKATAAVTLRIAEFDENGERTDGIKISLRRKCQKVQVTQKKIKNGYKITLSTVTKDADIYYTTDGSKPDKKSDIYDGSFIAEEGDIICAYAVKDGWKSSTGVEFEVSANAQKEQTQSEEDYDEISLEVLELVNEYRAEAGLSPLKMDPVLYKGTQIRAEELADCYSHIRPDDSDWYTVMEEIDFKYAFAGENIAYTEGKYSTPEAVMELWMGSPAHKKNILNTSGSLIGISVYKSGDRIYWAQLFGERQ